jgi:hypothetical protein
MQERTVKVYGLVWGMRLIVAHEVETEASVKLLYTLLAIISWDT